MSITSLQQQTRNAAASATLNATDMVIIGGPSLEAAAAEIPFRAIEQGTRLVIINREPTYLDSRADFVLRGDLAELFPLVVDEVQLER